MDLTVSPAQKDALIAKYPAKKIVNLRDDVVALKGMIMLGIPALNYQEPLDLYAVKACKGMPRGDKQYKVGDHIFAQFVAENSPMQINLSAADRQKVAKAAQQPATVVVGGRSRQVIVDVKTGTTFDVVMVEVETLSKNNLQTSLFNWLQQTRTQASALSGLNGPGVQEVKAELSKLASMGAPLL